uniref:RALGAPB_N domain-containing protein n=1 Tax=Globodera pallida TaxID=36090 RepID=A0A183BS80_GLOPA
MAENDKAADWPAIELCAPKLGILSNFSSSAADTVAHVLIRELVERVDRPSATDVNCFSNDQEVEWVMQVVNHALQLPFVPAQSHDTLRAAVRIYLAWASALTAAPHDCCPKQLLMHPDRYFRKILEALRFVFLDKPAPVHPSDLGLCLSRQGAQIRTVLNTVQHVAETVVDEFRDECWSRSLLFLINVTDQLLSVGRAPRGCQESIGCLMAGGAQRADSVPVYWRTLTALCRRCLHHVPLVECWARALLQLTVLLLRNLYGHELSNVHIDETRIFGPTTDDHPTFFPDHLGIVKNVWLNMFNLLGNPANFTREMFAQIEAHLGSKSSELAHFTEQTSLTFFLAVLAYKKMVDMFFDDPSVYIDFSESEDLHSQWLEALVNGEQRHHQQNEWDHQHNNHQPQIFGPTTDDHPTFFPDHLGIVKNVWLNMFNLLGNPANFTREMFAQIEAHLGPKSSELAHFTEQTSLTFFLAVLAYKKMVDMFFDDPSVYIDFSESEDLHSQWLEALVNGEQRHHQQNEWDHQHNNHQPQYGQQQLQHRLSNMSSLSVSHSVPNTPAPSVAAAARKSVAIDFPPPPELVAAALQLQLNSSNNGNRVRAEQHVWYTLRNNEFKQYSYNNSGPSSLSDHRQHHPLSGPLLAVFLQCLGDAALFQLHSVASSLTVVEPQKQHRLSGELSIGSLIITSLCRFIDQQLQKPPPHHSRDMHSTVVAAYSCMNVWLNAAPALAEIESCLCTVAQTIELGITGGRDMAPDRYKPASQRVRDAAEMLLHSLFADAHDKRTAIDEFALVQKFGLDLAQFRHFYIGESTILSLYEAQPVVHLSDGLPAVIAVFRTPFYEPWATTLQLLPQAKCRWKKCAGNGTTEYQKQQQQQQQQQNGFFSPHSDAQSPGCTSLTGQLMAAETELNSASSGHGTSSVDETATPNGQQQQQRRLSTTVKQFEIPREVLLPQCKLDAQFPRLEPVPAPVAEVQSQLAQIRARLAQGSGAPVGDRDTRNVWLNASLGAILTKAPTPERWARLRHKMPPQFSPSKFVVAAPLSSSTASSSSSTTTTTTSSSSNSSCGNYCSDPAMLGAVPHQFRSPSDFPAVEGVAAGRSTALAALCRIVCAKRSRERLDDEQLAQFFTILHEALISRDRLMLCALLFHTADELFKLALNGVQILLPNYVMAIDIVHTESMKLRLHPSASQAEMRAACLRALASVLAWPSVFGSNFILCRKTPPASNKAPGNYAGRNHRISRQGSSANLLETEQHYTDLRPCRKMQFPSRFPLRHGAGEQTRVRPRIHAARQLRITSYNRSVKKHYFGDHSPSGGRINRSFNCTFATSRFKRRPTVARQLPNRAVALCLAHFLKMFLCSILSAAAAAARELMMISNSSSSRVAMLRHYYKPAPALLPPDDIDLTQFLPPFCRKTPPASNKAPGNYAGRNHRISRQGSSANLLETEQHYTDLRLRMQRVLVHALRNESVPANVQLALALCALFACESARYDLALLATEDSEKRLCQDERAVAEVPTTVEERECDNGAESAKDDGGHGQCPWGIG